MLHNYTSKYSSIFIILISVSLLQLTVQIARCPFQKQSNTLISQRIQMSTGQHAFLPIPASQQSQCYNFTLGYPFPETPKIALSISDLSTLEPNSDLYFSVKPLESQSLSIISFLIRTYYKQTKWNKLIFSFVAENKNEIQASYYQIDSNKLGSCKAGKKIQLELPFTELNHNNVQHQMPSVQMQHKIFLSGFQMSTNQIKPQIFSPYQMQIIDSVADFLRIKVVIEVSSETQIYALHLSYLAWYEYPQNQNKIVSGSYVYSYFPFSKVQIYQHTPPSEIPANYARIYGLTGFKIENQGQIFTFFTQWVGSRFIFDFGPSNNELLKYFSFQYLFFVGSECSGCIGYPYSYNDTCHSYCPAGTSPASDNICISCPQGTIWDGDSCIKRCPEGQFINKTSNQCVCPPGLSWNDQKCIICTQGRVFNQSSKACECPKTEKWNGYGCVKGIVCENGKQWDIFVYECKCPQLTFWNGTYCIRKVTCSGGQFLNSNNECICPDGTFFKNGFCQRTGCFGGQIWNGTQCTCNQEHHWNGTFCILCINGQFWDPLTKQCKCKQNSRWNGQFCEKYIQCSNGRIYSESYDMCICPQGKFWNGIVCMQSPNCCCGQKWNSKKFYCQCPANFHFDGQKCVMCMDGKQWDPTTQKCSCRPGQKWNGNMCLVPQSCNNGMMWNQNTLSCECPSSTVWNGNFCILNPCSGGQVWDNSLKLCICIGNKVLIDSFCRPSQQSCQIGKIWNPNLYICECPKHKWDNGMFCEDIPQCISNQMYNPLNNKCQCQSGLIWLEAKNQCGDTTCPSGKRWDGYGCKVITCPPGSYYDDQQCVTQKSKESCQPWEYFDGQQCIYHQDTCPKNTKWNGQDCLSFINCPIGFYSQDNICKPFPQQCIPPSVWNINRCQSVNVCPYGTYQSSGTCKPQKSCENGQNWDQNRLQCVCPEGTGWNGHSCVICGNGQLWDINEGCICPQGYFFVGSRCQKPTLQRCSSIPNAIWESNKNLCVCQPGFTTTGFQCICKGVSYNNFCDRCAHRPNSQWKNNQCQCKNGYTLYGNQCLPELSGSLDLQSECGVGTYFNSQQKKCLACSDGCLSCKDSYTCHSCNPSFRMSAQQTCIENCGDGKKFVLDCDDGNNNDGDGCSRDCKVERGYICRGGSPNTQDQCLIFEPRSVKLSQTGLIRFPTKLTINIKSNYLPQALLQSSYCGNRCSQVLKASVYSNQLPNSSIYSEYIAGTTYSFVMDIEFGKNFLTEFTIQISINPQLKEKFFKGVDISEKLLVQVNPIHLSIVNEEGNIN